MKISLIVEQGQTEASDSLLAQAARLLNGWGVVVKSVVSETCSCNLAQIRPTADLYLLASSTPMALSLAGILHHLGAVLVNPYPVTNALHNKLIGLRILQAQGIPIVETHITTNLAQLEELLAGGPLVIKPYNTTQSNATEQNSRPIYTRRDLLAAALPPGPILAQRLHDPAARQWTLCCIGGHLLGMDCKQPERSGPWSDHLGLPPSATAWETTLAGNQHDPLLSAAEAPTLDELTETALRCGQAFDIDFFGLKVVEQRGVLYVTDMLSFPDCQGQPEAAPRLAEYLYARTQFLIEKRREG
jgi:hypothetical protein